MASLIILVPSRTTESLLTLSLLLLNIFPSVFRFRLMFSQAFTLSYLSPGMTQKRLLDILMMEDISLVERHSLKTAEHDIVDNLK